MSTQSEVVLLDGETGSAPILLYVTMGTIKVRSGLAGGAGLSPRSCLMAPVLSQICVNDDLVAKKFAVYHSQLAAGRELDQLEQEPLMLPCSLLQQTAGTGTPGKHTHTHTHSGPSGSGLSVSNVVPFTASSVSGALLTPPSTPQVSSSM